MKPIAFAIYPFLITIGSLAAADVELEKPAHYGGFNSFAFSPDGQTVAGGTGIATVTIGTAKSKHGGEVVLWDAKSGKLLKTFGKHTENPDWVAFDESGAILASAGPANGMVKLWDTKSGVALRTIDVGGMIAGGYNGDLVDMTADGSTVFTVLSIEKEIGEHTVKRGGELTAWDTKTGAKRWSTPDTALQSFTVAKDGKSLVGYAYRVGTYESVNGGLRHKDVSRHVVVWDVDSGQEVARLDFTNDPFRPRIVRFVPGSDRLIGVDTTTVADLDLEAGKFSPLYKMSADRRSWSEFRISDDGTKFARCWNKYIEIGDFKTGAAIGVMPANFLFGVTFAPDFKRAAGCMKARPTVFDLTALPAP